MSQHHQPNGCILLCFSERQFFTGWEISVWRWHLNKYKLNPASTFAYPLVFKLTLFLTVNVEILWLHFPWQQIRWTTQASWNSRSSRSSGKRWRSGLYGFRFFWYLLNVSIGRLMLWMRVGEVVKQFVTVPDALLVIWYGPIRKDVFLRASYRPQSRRWDRTF